MIIPMMKVVDLSDASSVLAEYAQDPHHEPVILAVRGKPVAVVLPAEGGDVESISVGLNPVFTKILARAQGQASRGETYSSEEVRREFGLPPYGKTAPRSGSRKQKSKSRKPTGEADGRKV
jgi:hypothetical protein